MTQYSWGNFSSCRLVRFSLQDVRITRRNFFIAFFRYQIFSCTWSILLFKLLNLSQMFWVSPSQSSTISCWNSVPSLKTELVDLSSEHLHLGPHMQLETVIWLVHAGFEPVAFSPCKGTSQVMYVSTKFDLLWMIKLSSQFENSWVWNLQASDNCTQRWTRIGKIQKSFSWCPDRFL